MNPANGCIFDSVAVLWFRICFLTMLHLWQSATYRPQTSMKKWRIMKKNEVRIGDTVSSSHGEWEVVYLGELCVLGVQTSPYDGHHSEWLDYGGIKVVSGTPNKIEPDIIELLCGQAQAARNEYKQACKKVDSFIDLREKAYDRKLALESAVDSLKEMRGL